MFRFACFSGGIEKRPKCDVDRANKKRKSKKKRKIKDGKNDKTKLGKLKNTRKTTKRINRPKSNQTNCKSMQSMQSIPTIPIPIKTVNTIKIAKSQTRLVPTAIDTELDVVLSGDEWNIPSLQFDDDDDNKLETPIIHRKQNSKIITRNRNKRKREQNKSKKISSSRSKSCRTPSYKIDLDDSAGYEGPKRYFGESPLPKPPPRKPSLSNISSNKSYLFSPSDARSNLYVFPSNTSALFVEASL